MAALLIIFAKEPAPGQVKTRLCPPLTPGEAARLAECFLADILAEMASLSGLPLALAFAPAGARKYFRTLTPKGAFLFPQQGADLGERMARAFDWGFAQGFTEVLLRGSDTPDLPAGVVQEAREVLAAGPARVVLGPAHDGGYYLVGLRGPRPELFRNIAWSGPMVLNATLERARRLSLPVHLLPDWRDLDTFEDLEQFLRQPHPAPRPGWRSHCLAQQLLGRMPSPFEKGG
jgi:rSAM/selenodomain-associated transferase 1